MTVKKDKIFSFTMVKNEEDIIESFVRYNINIFDGMIILDNGSSDDTLKILKLLENEYLPIYSYEDENPEFDQFNKRNQLLLKAINEFKADLIVPLDADEFIISSNKGNPRKILEKVEPDTLGFVKWKTYVPDISRYKNKKFIPAKITLTRDETLEKYYKVIISKKLIKDYQAILTPGCHDLKYDNKYKNIINRIICTNLRIAHFPLRSKEQTFSKIVVGWINDLHRQDKSPGESFHWQKIFDHLKENEEIGNEDVMNFAKEYALKGDIPKINLHEDPIDTSFCKNIEIIYTPDKVNPTSNLLESFEFLSMSHINFRKEAIAEEKRLKDEITGLSRELELKKEDEKHLKKKITEYENSLSWRITSPLRKIK